MRYTCLGCALAAVLTISTAHAQAPAQPSASAAAPQAAVANEDFRRLALMIESFDFESSRLATERASRPSIRRYAASLMQNFRFDYARLSAGAGVFSSIPSLPSDPNAAPAPFNDQRRATMLNQLAGATGRDFNKLYLDMQLGTRQEALGLYEAYAQSGTDPALVAFARERLPALQQEYVAARRLAGR